MRIRTRFFLFVCLTSTVQGQVEVRNESAALVLRNKQLTMALDKEQKGAIASLVDSATGQEFAARDSEPCLFRLGLSTPGDTSGTLIRLSNRDAGSVQYAVEDEGQRKAAKLIFEKIGGRPLQAECSVSIGSDNDAALWRFVLSGPDVLVVEEIEYPIVLLRAPLSQQDQDDAFVAGMTKGGVFHRPSQWPVGRAVTARQPSNLCAQFGCYYNAMAGFYSSTQDGKGYPKMLLLQRSKSGMEWAWRRECFHSLKQPFDLGCEIALTTFGARDRSFPSARVTWCDAADIYREWALKQPWCARTLAERSDLPGWLKEGPAMVRFSRHWLSRPERIEAWLNDYWQKYFPRAPLIVAFWGWEKFGSWVSPDYFPPYPSEEGLERCVQAVKSVGGHPFFWPSGYQWAVTYKKRDDGTFELDDRNNFERVGRPHTVMNRDGSPYAREYRWLYGGTNATLCRGDAWTRNWLNGIAVELTKRGADMIQIDQVVGAAAPGGGRCYSVEHGHPPGPGLWDTEAFAEQLRSMREACMALNPNIILGFEEPQELYIQQVGIQDYRDFQVRSTPQFRGHAPASVFGYLYHEFIPCFQSNPQAGNKVMMAYCLVNGQVPHLVPHWPVHPSPILRNGDFEEWNENVPDGWEHVKGYRGREFNGLPYCDGTMKRGGQFSLRLENQKPDDIVQVSQNVPIRRTADGLRVGKRYRMRLWFRAAELSQPNSINLGAFDEQMQAKGSWRIALAQSEDWKPGEVEFTMPDGAVRLRIMLHISGRCKVWLDDIVLEEADEVGGYQAVMCKGIPPEHDLALQWVRLFYGEGRPYLLLGRMLHPPPLLMAAKEQAGQELPAILHSAYRAPDGSEAVVAVNITDDPQEGVLRCAGKEIPLKLNSWEVKLIKL